MVADNMRWPPTQTMVDESKADFANSLAAAFWSSFLPFEASHSVSLSEAVGREASKQRMAGGANGGDVHRFLGGLLPCIPEQYRVQKTHDVELRDTTCWLTSRHR